MPLGWARVNASLFKYLPRGLFGWRAYSLYRTWRCVAYGINTDSQPITIHPSNVTGVSWRNKKNDIFDGEEKNRRQHFAWLTALTSHIRGRHANTHYSPEHRHSPPGSESTVFCDAAAYVIAWIANSLCDCQYTPCIFGARKTGVWCVRLVVAVLTYRWPHFFAFKICFSPNL